MNREQLLTFLLVYSWTMACFGCYLAARRQTLASTLYVLIGLATVAAVVAGGGVCYPGSPILAPWLSRLSFGHLPVAMAAFALASPWIGFALLDASQRSPDHPTGRRLQLWAFAGALTVPTASFLALMFAAPPVADGTLASPQAARVFHPEMEISPPIDLEVPGVCMALSEEGRIFIAYTTDGGGNGMEAGGIVEVIPTSAGAARVREVATSTLLWRSYGLETKDGDLYVSRSGRMARATQGQIVYDANGVVTRLRDLDGDGLFEFYHDVVTGLPGSQGPIAQHQNNGLLFRPDGSLLITSGNVGNRTTPRHPWEGALLEASPDFKEVSVFARGLRNPFSLTSGPDGEVFLIDQDWAVEGDELNHVERGAHFGHPYVVGMEEGEGFRQPLMLGETDSNLVSVAYSDSPELPAALRGCLYVTDYFKDSILRVELTRESGEFETVDVSLFAKVERPLDLAFAQDGTMYVLSRSKKVFRIFPKVQR